MARLIDTSLQEMEAQINRAGGAATEFASVSAGVGGLQQLLQKAADTTEMLHSLGRIAAELEARDSMSARVSRIEAKAAKWRHRAL